MKCRRIVLCLVICVAWLSGVSHADTIPAEKQKAIISLMEASGALNMATQFSNIMVGQMMEVLKQADSEVPARAYDIVRDEVNTLVNEEIGSFIAYVLPIYHRYFTLDEIREMVAFYESAVGRKVVQVMPSMMQESMAAGQQWAQGLEAKLVKRLEARFEAEGVEAPN